MNSFINVFVSLLFIFSNTLNVDAVNHKVIATRCPKCNGTMVRETLTIDALIDVVRLPCVHGSGGMDTYNVYGYIYRDRCGTCGYKEIIEVERYRTLVQCG